MFGHRGLACDGQVNRQTSRPVATAMQISNESLVVILLVGLIAGWLAGQIVQGNGFGIIGDHAILIEPQEST
jgi:F0F1-type ATP synthase assembly protein I